MFTTATAATVKWKFDKVLIILCSGGDVRLHQWAASIIGTANVISYRFIFAKLLLLENVGGSASEDGEQSSQ